MKFAFVVVLAACGGGNSPAPTPAPGSAAPVQAIAAPNGKGTVADRKFHSDALGVDKTYVVYTPNGYDANGTKRYPVFYYLHGLGGDEHNWVKGGHIDEAADKLGIQAIIVMPDGDDGFYTDSDHKTDYDACLKDGTGLLSITGQNPLHACVKHFNYETYIVKDLIADVDASFKTIAKREGRGIAGLSMGGLGAWSLGMRHPDLFAAAASHSGFLGLRYKGPHPYVAGNVELTDLSGGPKGNPLVDWVVSMYGTDVANWNARDPEQLIAKVEQGKPALYLDCGTEDEFKFNDTAAYIHDTLNARHIEHAYFTGPGHHNFEFWAPREVESLKWLQEHVAKP